MSAPLTIKYVIPPIPVEVVSKSKDEKLMQDFIVTEEEDIVSPSLPYMDSSIIDLQRLLDSDEDELKKLELYLTTWGAFQLVNHGIESSKLDQVLQVIKDFFSLPLEEKEKYGRSKGGLKGWNYDSIQGWGTDKMAENHAFNWTDRIILTVIPPHLRNPNFWPDEDVPLFSKVILDYAEDVAKLRDIVLRAVSKILKLPENNLITKYAAEGIAVARINWYPPSPYPDRIIGARTHSDSNIVTILLPDQDVEALQMEKDEQWFKVPIIPHALIVNASDMLEMMSNGKVKSSVHRVVTNTENERVSIAFACGPQRNSVIEPLEELISEEEPRRYPTLLNSSNYTADFFARGKILVKEIRKHGPSVVQKEEPSNDTMKSSC
ncbi:hypothetical protein RND81_04G181900 [Saponaria officinalis]|uniref:Fe2OG dioxygenase domain-containing protein n=1 Tax=Saponaria officinalis TaxID=3572 RepID=A0AAW1LM64_SAPOF